MAKAEKAMRYVLIGLIKCYQWVLSPIMGNACRFQPTCSHYGIEAIRTHGAIKGSYLTIKRIARCQPLCKGGYDPVPPKKGEEENSQNDGTTNA